MKISFESELMKNHKQADVMGPDSIFRAVQTVGGHALLFSIGTDGIFYLSKETLTDITGWVKTDLSSGLSKSTVTAKSFDVALNKGTGLIDIALAVTIDGKDHLYLSAGISNADAVWNNAPVFTEIVSDDPDYPASSVVIAGVYLSNTNSSEYFVVDVLKQPGNPLNYIYRFFIDPKKAQGMKVWNKHPLPGDLVAGTVSSAMGIRYKDRIDGMYTMGKIGNEEELFFTPLCNVFDTTTAPTAVNLAMPSLASAMCLAPNADNSTNLYIAGDKALYLYDSKSQKDASTGAVAVQVVASDVFAGVQSLYADVVNRQVYIWGLNQAGSLFYLYCPLGKEKVAGSWSYPLTILDGVEQITSYANVASGHSVIFAHTSGQKLVQLTQDPLTAAWQQRSILLPTTDTTHVLEYNSFTTHLRIANDNGSPTGGRLTLSLTSGSPVGIYIDNVYHKLSPDVVTDLETDNTGVLTIVQETEVLTAICYHVVHNDSGASLDVNPMAKMIDRISEAPTSADLDKVQLDNGDGTTQSLFPAGTTQDQKDATSAALNQFVTLGNTFTQPAPAPAAQVKSLASASTASVAGAGGAVPAAAPKEAAVAEPKILWGVSYKGDAWTYHEGDAAVKQFAPQAAIPSVKPMAAAAAVAPSISLGSSDDPIVVGAEHFFGWVKDKWDDVTDFFTTLEGDLNYIILKIEDGRVFKLLVDCLGVVIKAVEFVFNKIKVFFEDLIKYLGFLFNWGDIVRTHQVLKNVIKTYASHCVGNIDDIKNKVINAFKDLETNVNNWAGMPAPDNNMNDLITQGSSSPGQHSPQSNWAIHHSKSNIENSTLGSVADFAPALTILDELAAMLEREEGTFQEAIDNIKDLISNFSSLSVLDVLKRIIAILTDVLLETIENVVLTVIDVIQQILNGVVEVLDAKIDIPVISWLYKQVAGDDLSMLDLCCLIAAIPVNVIYKLIHNEAPFADDSTSQQLIAAKDFDTILAIYQAAGTVQPSVQSFGGGTVKPMAAMATMLVPTDNPLLQKFQHIGNVAACFGAVALCFINYMKNYNNVNTKTICLFGAVSYLVYVAPDIMGVIPRYKNPNNTWIQVTNEFMTDVCVLKTMADAFSFKRGDGPQSPENLYKDAAAAAEDGYTQNYQAPNFIDKWNFMLSPKIEFVLNALWQFPTTAFVFLPDNRNASGWVNFGGGTAFDIGGMLAWPSSIVPVTEADATLKTVAFGLSEFANVLYGGACLAQEFIPS